MEEQELIDAAEATQALASSGATGPVVNGPALAILFNPGQVKQGNPTMNAGILANITPPELSGGYGFGQGSDTLLSSIPNKAIDRSEVAKAARTYLA